MCIYGVRTYQYFLPEYSVQAYFNPLRNIEMAPKIKAACVRASFLYVFIIYSYCLGMVFLTSHIFLVVEKLSNILAVISWYLKTGGLGSQIRRTGGHSYS